ncbi:hypothetical protein PLICRDRAFT_649240 [Plicaturopsis crispa FD-325 SS-3]|nr:hypothetical protein PLICRDRAFT_649240 [Plicaturopsis crispa FD-325 SS-3]
MGSHGDRPHPTNWLERPDLIIHNVRIPYKDTDGLWVIKCRGGRVWSVKPNHNFREGPISIASTRVVDGKGGLLLPSLCHAHIHLDKCFILDECEPLVSGTFSEAMEVTKKAKAKFHQRREDLYARGHRIITESLEYGVTSIRAHVEIDKVVRFACLDVALKLADEWKGSCDVQICAFAQEALFDRPKDDIPTDNFALLKMACARDGVMVVGSAPYVEPTIKQAKQNIDLILDLSMERGIHADFHLDYNLDPKSEPLIYHVVDRVRARKWGGLLKIPCLTSTEMHVTIGHATRLTLFSPDEWRDLQARIGSLPISIVGLPQSDMYMMGRSSAPLGAPRGTLRIPQLAAEHGINAAMSVNNIENAFTPQGSLDPLTLCSLGVGVFQSGRPADLDVLLRSVTLTAKRAIGLHNIPDQLHPAKRERADFVIIHNATSLQSAVLNPSFDRTTIFAGKVVAYQHSMRWNVRRNAEIKESRVKRMWMAIWG